MDIVLELFDEFKAASDERRWPLLLAILDAGDPYLPTARDDPIWIGQILNSVPYIFAYYADSVVSDRKRKQS